MGIKYFIIIILIFNEFTLFSSRLQRLVMKAITSSELALPCGGGH